MNTPESNFDLVSCDSLFARIEENLSSYVNNGALDSSRFYPEIKWFIQQMGLAVFEFKEGIILLEKNRVELPCDFYMLDSAWLCDSSTTAINNYFQGKYVFFTEKTCETILNDQTCATSSSQGYCVNTDVKDKVLDRVTITEYVTGGDNVLQYSNLHLLRYNNKKSIGTICNKHCKNLFSSSPYEISINKQGGAYYLQSNLKDATIYLKYWRFPMDMETGLPLIPNDAIIQKALEMHLTHWFLVNSWVNGDDVNIENKIKYYQVEKDKYLTEAKIYAKFPSFFDMVRLTRNTRARWDSYNIQNYHL